MKNIIIIIGLLILLVGAFYLSRQSGSGLSNPLEILNFNFGKRKTATILDQKFTLIEAKTEKQKQIGLSGRSSLPKNQGMLFEFGQPQILSFWMKDMKFPIDIIFINNDKIVSIQKNINPPSSAENLPLYQPEEPADKVIEINAGLSDQYGFKKGDTVLISN